MDARQDSSSSGYSERGQLTGKPGQPAGGSPGFSPSAGRLGLALSVVVAAVAFTLLFTGVVFDFWLQMTASVLILCVLSYVFDPAGCREMLRSASLPWPAVVLGGCLSAAALYGVFYAGHFVSRTFAFSRSEVAAIYALKEGADPRLVAFLMAFVIGPGEEIFWRGYVQRTLAGRPGSQGLVLSVAAYGLVHLGSGSVTLIGAALVCGLFWGCLYQRFKSIWLNVISHVLWDIAVFLVWPFAAS